MQTSQKLYCKNCTDNEMDNNFHISYQINSRDEIVFVNDHWSDFAVANSGSDIVRKIILQRSLWSCISNSTTEYIYREILRRVRAGQAIQIKLRCDSAELRRLIELTICPQQDGEVQFDSRPIWIQSRMLPILFKNNAPRTDNLLIICSWCNKIETGNGKWQEVEEAVESLGLFELEILPMISHGMCDSCYQTVSLKLEELKTA